MHSAIDDVFKFSQGNNRMSINEIPRNVQWGKSTLSAFLCNDMKPIVITVVGCLQSVWLMSRTGKPLERVSVGLEVLRDCNINAANAVLTEFCSADNSE